MASGCSRAWIPTPANRKRSLPPVRPAHRASRAGPKIHVNERPKSERHKRAANVHLWVLATTKLPIGCPTSGCSRAACSPFPTYVFSFACDQSAWRGVDRQLHGRSPLVGWQRLATGDIAARCGHSLRRPSRLWVDWGHSESSRPPLTA
jgi:hypothetical protein